MSNSAACRSFGIEGRVAGLPAWPAHPDIDLDTPRKFRLLVIRFTAAGIAILISAMLMLGWWVSSRIESSAQQLAAHSAAFFLESLVDPIVQEISSQSQLSAGTVAALDDVLRERQVAERISGMTIRGLDGTILYDAEKGRIGMRLKLDQPMQLAREGRVEVRQSGGAVFKIFAPVRRLGTGEVIAVTEYSESAEHLGREISQTRTATWAVVGLLTSHILLFLVALVVSASRIVGRQHSVLVDRYREQVLLNRQNAELRGELSSARLESIEINEQFLRRVGADLHDGPAQLLALVMLRLEELQPAAEMAAGALGGVAPPEVLEVVQRATADALREVRDIAAGLALPELELTSPEEALRFAVAACERSTGMKAELRINCVPQQLPLTVLVCLYRVVQEALSNAYRHAGGKGVRVTAACRGPAFEVVIEDAGPGFEVSGAIGRNGRMGLAGLKHRIESVGGSFVVASVSAKGTQVRAVFPNPFFTGHCHV